MAVPVQVTFDCHDPDRVARFWAGLLGYELQPPPPGFSSWPEFLAAQGMPEEDWNAASAVVDPEGTGPRLFFQRVPEAKTVKNRVHLDVNVGGGREVHADERHRRVEEAAAAAVAAGATRVRDGEQWGEWWIVMQDPEGNEFCLQ